MAEIICSQCGYSNEEGSTVCFICDNPLTPSEQTGKVTEKPVENLIPQNSKHFRQP